MTRRFVPAGTSADNERERKEAEKKAEKRGPIDPKTNQPLSDFMPLGADEDGSRGRSAVAALGQADEGTPMPG